MFILLPRLRIVVWLSVASFCLHTGSGCADSVQEDRTIEWSSDGTAVGFQHDQHGIFVADETTGELKEVFRPEPDVLAVSTPLWSADGKHMIFTTAKAANPEANQAPFPRPAWDDNPAGRSFGRQPIVYTCWRQEKSPEGELLPPVEIFEAACDHVGYVAANLAVRWHPTENRVLYVDAAGESNKHTILEFDPTSKTSRQVFHKRADAVLFDWTPDGRHLVCVMANAARSQAPAWERAFDGIWIGRPEHNTWWHVPESKNLADVGGHNLIEGLRATRPAWHADGHRFAFTTFRPAPDRKGGSQFILMRGDLSKKRVDVLQKGNAPYRDLRWSPDGTQLGFIQGTDDASLQILNLARETTHQVGRHSVRRFAGWDSTGNHLAYVVPLEVSATEHDHWSFLFVADPQARDAVYISDGAGSGPGRVIFSGMRVTFPNWSPNAAKLSLWATFAPSHRSWFSWSFGWGLRKGDPALILDTATGELAWMPVNADEKAQVGHYYLLKKNYTEANRWYQQADAEMPPEEKIEIRDLFRRPRGRRRFLFMHYHCLMKLGMVEEAKERLALFNKLSIPEIPENDPEQSPTEQFWPDVQDREEMDFALRIIRDMFLVEIYISFDASDDGDKFFSTSLAKAKNDSERLSKAIAYAQFLLHRHQYVDYTTLVTETVAPLMIQRLNTWKPTDQGNKQAAESAGNSFLAFTGVMTLLPMYADDFLSELPTEKIEALLPAWLEMRKQAKTESTRLGVDLFLRAGYQRLGRDEQARALAARIEKDPVRSFLLSGDSVSSLIELIEQLQKSMVQIGNLLEAQVIGPDSAPMP